MPQNLKFPPSVEIERGIAAAVTAGVQIGSVEIQPRKIIIFARDPNNEKSKELTYSEWKATRREIR
jgi:hypothetical protein